MYSIMFLISERSVAAMMLTARIKSCAAAVCVLAGCLLLPNAQAKAESISLP